MSDGPPTARSGEQGNPPSTGNLLFDAFNFFLKAEETNMPTHERFVFLAYANHGRLAWPGIDEIGTLTKLGTTRARKAVRELEKRRWLIFQGMQGEPGRQTRIFEVRLDGDAWPDDGDKRKRESPPERRRRLEADPLSRDDRGNTDPSSHGDSPPYHATIAPPIAAREAPLSRGVDKPLREPLIEPLREPPSNAHARAEDDNEELGGRPWTSKIGRTGTFATIAPTLEYAASAREEVAYCSSRVVGSNVQSAADRGNALAINGGESCLIVTNVTTPEAVKSAQEQGAPVGDNWTGGAPRIASRATTATDQGFALAATGKGDPWTSTSKPATEDPSCFTGSLSSAEPATAPRNARYAAEQDAFVDGPSATAGQTASNAATVKGTESASTACLSTAVAQSAVVLKTESREAISWPYPTLRLKSATTETSCPATADRTVSADVARDTEMFSGGQQHPGHEKKLGLAPTVAVAASVPTAEQPSFDFPEPEKPAKKGRKQPPKLLTVEALTPEERKINDAIRADPSLDPIVPCAPQTARDLLRAAPEVNVALQVARAGAWLRANPQRRKSRGGAFLLNWVSRQEPDAEYVRQREEERQRAEREANRRNAPPLPPLEFKTDGGIFKGKEPAEIFAMLEKKLCNTLPRETEPVR